MYSVNISPEPWWHCFSFVLLSSGLETKWILYKGFLITSPTATVACPNQTRGKSTNLQSSPSPAFAVADLWKTCYDNLNPENHTQLSEASAETG